MGLAKDDIKDLRYAKTLQGTPIEKGFEQLPATWRDVAQRATEKSLERLYDRELIRQESEKSG